MLLSCRDSIGKTKRPGISAADSIPALPRSPPGSTSVLAPLVLPPFSRLHPVYFPHHRPSLPVGHLARPGPLSAAFKTGPGAIVYGKRK